MNQAQYIQCFLGGMLGILAHVFIFKIPALKEASRVSNVRFRIGTYLNDDWAVIFASFLSVVIVMFVMDEIIAESPCIAENIKWFFITIGYTGSSIIQTKLGRSSKKINEVINYKTDIADKQPIT